MADKVLAFFKAGRLHNNTNRVGFNVDDGVAVVIVVFGPIVVIIVVVVGRGVGVAVAEKLGWAGQHLPKVRQEARVVFLEAGKKNEGFYLTIDYCL